MKITILVLRILLGLVFFVFGLNGFFHFIDMEAPTGDAGSFLGGLASAAYFFPILKITETLSGAALLAGKFIPLSLILLAPINLHIFLFHLFLEPSGIPMGAVMIILHLFLAYQYRESYAAILKP